MNVNFGAEVDGGGGQAGDGGVSGDDQAGRAMQNPGAQVLTLFGPPSLCIPSIEVVAVIAATDPNTRNDGAR